LIFDKAVIEGEGLDLLIQGSVNLKNSEADLTVFIVPLKTVDTIIRNIPLVGKTIIRLVGGRKGHIITIPVSVTGDIKDPVVKLMPTKAVGKAAIEWLLDTVTYPMELLPGVTPISEGADQTNIEEDKSSDAELLEGNYNEE
ncbi:MAG: AsmA-like C-terminal domain-containing protein, partial [Desulfobulbaceae bacterium]|nr:AsmA-like C-terminal domain-containing protein [Desulfobulbaceae bacterium]